MGEAAVLLTMVKALVEDINQIQQRGAGYYRPRDFISKYNSLLATARELYPDDRLLGSTMSPIEETPSHDPADKMKDVQKVILEAGQLIAFLKARMGSEAGGEKK